MIAAMSRRMAAAAALLVAATAWGALTATASASARAALPAVVFDTDMDFDDAAALAYLAAQHKAGSIRLRAVAVENDGAGAAGLAGTQARCLLDRFGLREVPVAQGPSGVPVWPSLTAGTAAIMATLIAPCPRLSLPADPGEGAALLARVAREERELRVFATGPMTNLASALRQEPALRRAELIHVNGGDIAATPDPLLDEGLQRDGTPRIGGTP
jgi:inosine-uridine nucleoside N-ribohydrolase